MNSSDPSILNDISRVFQESPLDQQAMHIRRVPLHQDNLLVQSQPSQVTVPMLYNNSLFENLPVESLYSLNSAWASNHGQSNLQRFASSQSGLLGAADQLPNQFDSTHLMVFLSQKLQGTRQELQCPPGQLNFPTDPMLQRTLQQPYGGWAGNNLNMNTYTCQSSQNFSLPSPNELVLREDSRRMRGGVIEPFPEKLHRLLTEVETAGLSDVISFVAGGKAFAIHKPDKFFRGIVPIFFRQSRLSSFKRQLNLYGFELINTGPARGAYYHELFVKDRPELCRQMRRIAVKVHGSKPRDVYNQGIDTSSPFHQDESETLDESTENSFVGKLL
jgi:HSF-type DNA-binding